MKRTGVVLILLFAFCGLVDSAYIALHEMSGTPLICDINHLSGCNTVVASPYSYLFGIPLAEYGILFYCIVLVLAALELVVFDQLLRRALQGISLVGVIASLYFTLMQVFVIKAFCVYCLGSAFIAVLILILSTFIEPIDRRVWQKSPAPPLAG
ncbi:MAG: vitamin K epoxide reductase family protein [Patescibacteria group bacterium]|nr:vitamin K epoxide reductase family protein [Patescibacteria group bacterium]